MTGRGLALALTLLAAMAPAYADEAASKNAKPAPAAAPAPPPLPPDPAAVERKYLERAAIAGADKVCNLFTAPERLALQSGLYQAEGELLRAGYSPDRIAEMTDQVHTRTRLLGCDHPSVTQVAGTIRAAYRQFAHTNYLEYPGLRSTWGASRSEHDSWAASQKDKATGAIFGLRRPQKDGEPDKSAPLALALALPESDYTPMSVLMLGRNPNKMGDPWLGALGAVGGASTTAPRSVSNVDWAGKVSEEDDASGNTYQVFYFSPAAIAHIEAMDPRESVAIEITPSPMQKKAQSVRIVFEVGDIRAAHAFAMIPQPTYVAPASTAEAAPAKEH